MSDEKPEFEPDNGADPREGQAFWRIWTPPKPAAVPLAREPEPQ